MVCSIDGCDRRRYARGWCRNHYMQWYRKGTPHHVHRVPADDRFWPKVDRNGPYPLWAPFLGRCWIWTAGLFPAGYGCFKVDGVSVGAHRFAYELAVGDIPEGLTIDHVCRVRACCNPSHLEVVTYAENIYRARLAG